MRKRNKLELAEKYLEAIGSVDVIEFMIDSASKNIDLSDLCSEDKEKFLEIKNALTWNRIKDVVCEFIANNTPETVLHDTIRFYESESGKYWKRNNIKDASTLAEMVQQRMIEIIQGILGEDFNLEC